MSFMDVIKENAKKDIKTIVLPEGTEERMVKAAEYITQEKIATIILLGNQQEISQKIDKLNLDLSDVKIVNPKEADNLDEYINQYHELRKHKGLTLDEAKERMENELFYGAMMVRNGDADGAVAGSVNPTGNVMLAAFHIIGLAEGASIASSCFAMIIPEFKSKKDYVLFFADCAILPNPNASQLADIAIATADTRKALLNDEPRVAMLSYSTKGSASGEMVDKVVKATSLAKEKRPDLKIDGELQLDAAIVPGVAERKAPESDIAGIANVLIFPDLNAGNIGYKLVQRLAKAKAFGPFSQGLAKPYNDLSRGCSVEDIVNVVAVSAVKAQRQ